MKKIYFMISVLAIIATAWLVKTAFAQESETSWSEPLNLSRSGGTTDPHIVADAFGRVHVLWQDDFAGLVYTQRTEEGWSAPTPISLPFVDDIDTLVLVPDSQGIIHAGWLDDDGTLYYSSVPGDKFGTLSAWEPAQLVAFSAADFAMTAAPDARMHIAFIRSDSAVDFPAGVYSRFKYPGIGWSIPRVVYTSPYLRGLDASQAQLSLAADAQGQVFLAWDVTPQEMVFLAKSSDSGSIWADPQEMDRRQPNDGGSNGPSRPIVITGPNGTALTWEAGHQGDNCGHYVRQTSDGGATWTEATRFPAPFDETCAQRVQVLQSPDQNGWLALTSPAGLSLIAWDPAAPIGGQLSPPRLQPALSSFINPDTYRQVSLACRSVALSGNTLVAVACESDKNGDIWQLERLMDEPASWFPTPTPLPAWSTPNPLATASQSIHRPAVVGDAQGRLHTFWTQEGRSSIYYALWDGEAWTTAIALLSSPGGAPQAVTAAFHPDGRLLLAWSDPASASLYYSQVPTSQSFNLSAWDVPQPVPLAGLYATDPQLSIASDGSIYLVSAVALNEGRGIYLLRGRLPSQPGDQGLTWSEPEIVFDAVAAGWGSVGNPYIAITNEGALHILWTRLGLPPKMETLGLSASNATGPAPEDSAQLTTGWSEAQEVVRGEILWSQLLSSTSTGNYLHRAWQQISAGQPILLHQQSTDAGLTWSEPARITNLENTNGPAAMAYSADGTLNLLQIVPKFGASQAGQPAWNLQRWTWLPVTGWQQADSQPVPGLLSATAVALAGGSKGGLGAWMTGQAAPLAESTPEPASSDPSMVVQLVNALVFMGRSLEASPSNPPGSASGVTPTVEAGSETTPGADELQGTPSPSATVAPGAESGGTAVPTAVPDFSRQPPSLIQDLFSNSFSGVAISIVPAILLVLIIFFLGMRGLFSRK